MTVHFFHCSDGTDLVLDRAGHRARSRRERLFRAYSVAEKLMQGTPSDIDWSRWVVSVHTSKGEMIEVVPFPADTH
jgi:hypothetical protein